MAPGVDFATGFVVDWSGDQLAVGANVLGEGLPRYERRKL
jgi:hypothetical protein